MRDAAPISIKQDTQYAAYMRRIFAFCIDFAILAVLYVFVKPLLTYLPVVHSGLLYALLGFVLLNVLFLLYLSIMEASKLHGSLGKYLLGMKVVKTNGQPCTFAAALTRNAVKLFTCSWLTAIAFQVDTIRAQVEVAVLFSISTNPIWHDFLAVTGTEDHHHQLVHDQVARTKVIMANL